MKLKLLVPIIILGSVLFSSCSAHKLRKRSVVKVDLKFDSAELIRQNGALNLNLVARLNNGKIKSTYGFENGTWSYERFLIRVENGAFLNGTLFYNAREIYEDDKTINVIVTPRNNANYTDTFKIRPPQPIEVQVFPYPYADFTINTPIKMELAVTYDNGTRLTTPLNKNSFLWDFFKLEHEGAVLSSNTINIEGNTASIPVSADVKAFYTYNKSINGTTQVTLDYKARHTLNFSGSNGWSGQNSRRNWSTATKGNNGGNGQQGGYGVSGRNGENITVYCDVVNKNKMTLLVVKVKGNSKEELAIVNTSKGELYINNNGGNGGSGGAGGRGGEGSHESEEHRASIGGNGGVGGSGGNGGNGGSINLYISNEALPFLSLIRFNNGGGLGGRGGNGGRSGRGGLPNDANLLDLVFGGTRGNTGVSGAGGLNGLNGPPVAVKVLPRKAIRQNMDIK